MEDRRILVREVAEACGVTELAVINWRKGSLPNSKHLASLAAFLNVSRDYLLNGEESGTRAELIDKMNALYPHISTADLVVALQVLQSFAQKT